MNGGKIIKIKNSDKTTVQMLFRNFAKEMDNLGGNTFLMEEREVPSKLITILSNTVNELVCYQTPLIERFIPKTFLNENNDLSIEWLSAIRPREFNKENYRRKMIQADAGLIAADYLIADSATIVLFGENHRAQLVTLLPPTLIVLATAKQLIPDLFTFHKIMQKKYSHAFPTFHYITGPSRTSDIEKTLILGVHGPIKLYVLIVEE